MTDEELIETSKSLLHPDVTPPLECHTVAEPHVRILMNNIANGELFLCPAISVTFLFQNDFIPGIKRYSEYYPLFIVFYSLENHQTPVFHAIVGKTRSCCILEQFVAQRFIGRLELLLEGRKCALCHRITELRLAVKLWSSVNGQFTGVASSPIPRDYKCQ